ncbi:MAG: glycosyltransferase, partial [Bacteroidia bacterium]
SKKVYFTFHLPYLTCYKNDFRYYGIEDCNNFSSVDRCVNCIIAARLHFNKRAEWYNPSNLIIKSLTPVIKKSKSINTLKARLAFRRNQLDELILVCNEIFIYGKWFDELLKKNGYDYPVFKVIPHISNPFVNDNSGEGKIVKNKIVFVGRIEPQKGLHLLCKAMSIITTRNLELDVYGNRSDEDYYNRCKQNYNFNYKGAVQRTELLGALKNYDFLILPSVFTEMYSLALKEAFYERLPAIVSSAKGNKDVVIDGRNGFVFHYDNYSDLARVIDKAYSLKKENWQPVFENTTLPENDIRKILSFYN